MNTPTAALAWQLWRGHRRGLMILVGTLLAFLLVYPQLCAWMDFNLDSRNAGDELARLLAPSLGRPGAFQIIRVLFIAFLIWAPALAMAATLLYGIWLFTFTEIEVKSKEVLTFPGRIFTLPVSTAHLFWGLWLSGLAVVSGLYLVWFYCVRMPHLPDFPNYQNCFAWLTLLVLVQALVWTLAGWPLIRVLALLTIVSFFLVSPAPAAFFTSPLFLLPLFLLGTGLSRTGLQKMRHGQWQAWNWPWPLIGPSTHGSVRPEFRGPTPFASPAQAQLWFEWRQVGSRMFFFTAVLALVPVAVLFICQATGYGTLDRDTLRGFILYLLFLPALIHFSLGTDRGRKDMSFLLLRPLASGELLLARLKTAAISVGSSWLVVLAVLGVLPWLVNFNLLKPLLPWFWDGVAVVIGLIFLTWRVAVAYLGIVLSGSKRVAQGFVILFYAQMLATFVLFIWITHNGLWLSFWNVVPLLAAGLIVVKCVLAWKTFRTALQRRLLTPSAVRGYLAVWTLLVAVLLATLLPLVRSNQELVLPATLGIILLVPLARIGFTPLAVEWSRHQPA